MINPLTELQAILQSNAKKERKIMKVVGVLSGGQVRCELSGNSVILDGSYALSDSVIVIDSQIVALAHSINNEYEV